MYRNILSNYHFDSSIYIVIYYQFYSKNKMIFYYYVSVAQWIARWTSNPEAAGSNPVGDVIILTAFILMTCVYDIN